MIQWRVGDSSGRFPKCLAKVLIGLALLPGLMACSHPAVAEPGGSTSPEPRKATQALSSQGQATGQGHAPPSILVLDRLQNVFGPVTFAHEAHVAFASEGCSQCHHHQAEAEAIKVCGDCHDRQLFPSAEKLNRPGLSGAYHRQCIQCHVDMGSGPIGCIDCHKPKDQAPGPNR